MDVKAKLQSIKDEAEKAIRNAANMHSLNEVKASFLGKKSAFNDIMKSMKDLSKEDRPIIGKETNIAKQKISQWIEQRKVALEAEQVQKQINEETVDVTMPGKSFSTGTVHLLSQIIDDIEDVFVGMGYQVMEGPEVEIDEYNFEKLNLPKDHPARDMQDTFYIDENRLLRTHTSPVQVRTMLEKGGQEPVKIICPGKVYRRDEDDATHSHQFMQIEGLVVDENTTMADLKGTLLTIAQTMFGKEREIRMRPSYFPFTEPSVEVDVSCHNCGGKGCNICKHTGWIEVLGAGMVNNNVLEASGYESTKYQGYAFGVGVERLAMLKYKINDIRMFYTNDLRFNSQFKK